MRNLFRRQRSSHPRADAPQRRHPTCHHPPCLRATIWEEEVPDREDPLACRPHPPTFTQIECRVAEISPHHHH